MKKILPVLMFLTLPIAGLQAQTMDLAGNLDSSTAEEISVQEDEKKVADDRGIFSFLNFSFIKKPLFQSENKTDDKSPADTADDQVVAETPLQKMIRQAESGNVEAQLSLGYMYLYGENGVESDFPKAFHYYEMAAAQNDKIALNNLGSLYFNGIGTPTDYFKAAQLFAKAAQNGSDDAAVNLAFIYLSGTNQNKQLEEAVNLFKQAAEAGNNTAKFMLGYAYYTGFQVPQDYYKAVSLMREASAAQFDEAQYMLGLMYMKGHGIAKNYGNAMKYFREAFNQGNVSATMILGDILTQGVMYPKNLIQAHIYYNIASVYGAPHAAERRDALESSLKIEDLLPAQSQAESFKPQPSELTAYIRQTFGGNIRRYIDENNTKRVKK